MCFYLVAWTVLFVVCLVIGTAVLNLTTADHIERQRDRAILAVWLGLIILAIALLAISLLLPLSPLVGLGVTLGFVSISLSFRANRAALKAYRILYSQQRLLLAGILAIVIAAFSTREVAWFDTGLYHYGVVKWLSTFGTVPGMGLINARFGFTSAWFALLAPFDSGFLTARSSAVANSFVLYLAIWQLLISLRASVTKEADETKLPDRFMAVFLLITLPIAFVIKFPWLMTVSTAPDFPLILLIGIISWTILLIKQDKPTIAARSESTAARSESTQLLDVHIIPIILAAGAMSIKLNGLTLVPIAALFYLMGGRLTWQRIMVAVGLPFLLLLPMFLYGYVILGFPLFPTTLFGLDLPWTMQTATAQRLEAIPNPWVPTAEHLTVFERTWQWLVAMATQWLPRENLNFLIPLFLLISAIAGVQILQRFRQRKFEGRLWLLLFGFSGSALVMLKSPLLRHGLGYFALLPAYLIADQWSSWVGLLRLNRGQIRWPFSQQKLNQLLSFSLFAVLTCTLILLGAVGHLDYIFVPSLLPKATLNQAQVNDVIYYYPTTSSQCWAEAIPCSPGIIQHDIQLRNPAQGIRGGFVNRN